MSQAHKYILLPILPAEHPQEHQHSVVTAPIALVCTDEVRAHIMVEWLRGCKNGLEKTGLETQKGNTLYAPSFQQDFLLKML